MSAREAFHASGGVELYTPEDIASASAKALGGRIDLDPASCAFANRVIKATRFFDRDGLDLKWKALRGAATVFLNPPGGTLNPETLEPMPYKKSKKTGKLVQVSGGISAAAVWWFKLLTEYRLGHVRAAVFHCFRLDVLQTVQGKKFRKMFPGFEPPQAFPFCIYKARTKHYSETGAGKSPSHACAAFFLAERPPGSYPITGLEAHRIGRNPSAPQGVLGASSDRFRAAFEPLGYVR